MARGIIQCSNCNGDIDIYHGGGIFSPSYGSICLVCYRVFYPDADSELLPCNKKDKKDKSDKQKK